MTAVITAILVTSVVFKKSSIYWHLSLSQGMNYRNSPMAIALRRIGVASVMERNFIQRTSIISYSDARQLLEKEPRWILILGPKEQNPCFLPGGT
jgi:hypothetical protein